MMKKILVLLLFVVSIGSAQDFYSPHGSVGIDSSASTTTKAAIAKYGKLVRVGNNLYWKTLAGTRQLDSNLVISFVDSSRASWLSDSAKPLYRYVQKGDSSTGVRYATKLDTLNARNYSNSLYLNNVDSIYRTLGKDSIQILIDGRYYAIKDSVGGAGSGANTALSNLASVAINTSLLPTSNGSSGFGSTSKQWGTIFQNYAYYHSWYNDAGTFYVRLQPSGEPTANAIITVPIEKTGVLALQQNGFTPTSGKMPYYTTNGVMRDTAITSIGGIISRVYESDGSPTQSDVDSLAFNSSNLTTTNSGNNVVTVNTVQDIGTGASPTFGNITTSGELIGSVFTNGLGYWDDTHYMNPIANVAKGHVLISQGADGTSPAYSARPFLYPSDSAFSVTSSIKNKNVTSYTQQTDTSAFVMDFTTGTGKPKFSIVSPTGTTNFNVDSSGVANSAVGFRIANAATNSSILMGNGTNFVSTAVYDTITKAIEYSAIAAVDSDYVWECPYGSATVVSIRAVRVGGTSASINVRKNASSALALLSSDYSVTTSMADGTTLQNNTLVLNDMLKVHITAISGTVTKLFIQLRIRRQII